LGGQEHQVSEARQQEMAWSLEVSGQQLSISYVQNKSWIRAS
jgi:hypothetical protein